MKVVLGILLLSFSVPALCLDFSDDGPTAKEVSDARENLDPVVMAMKGVNGVGTTACVEQTGIPFHQLDENEQDDNVFVNCISVMTETDDAARALQTLFPLGSKYKGIYISIEYIGGICAGC